MEMQLEHEARTCTMDMLHEHAERLSANPPTSAQQQTYSTVLPEFKISSADIRHQ
jgi:hypothetical protein